MTDSRPTPRLVTLSLRAPRAVLAVTVLLTVVAAAGFLRLEVDTDPENMLPGDHPVRVENEQLRASFGSRDLLVVGLTQESGLTGRDDALPGATEEALLGLQAEIEQIPGVTADAVVGPATALATPAVDPEADLVAAIDANPLLVGSVLTADRTTVAYFVPLDDPGDVLDVADAIDDDLDEEAALAPLDRNVAGLPLAQEAFGAQMFVQMGIFAPLAGLFIFVLLYAALRRLSLVLPAMALAMVSVIVTMGLLMGSGNTLHIMSSMIPIFLMPIAILDSVHVLSEFHDDVAETGDLHGTIRSVYSQLGRPLAFTTLTTGVGFASLALADIPPVRVFGLFIAAGVVIAWLLTVTFLPAWLSLLNPDRLPHHADPATERMGRLLPSLGRRVVRHRVGVLAGFGLVALAAIPLVTRIEVNDNPVNWFRPGAEIRVASEALNERLPGTFTADLVLRADEPGRLADPDVLEKVDELTATWGAAEPVGSTVGYPDLLTPEAAAGGDAAAAQLEEAAASSVLARSLITEDGRAADLRLFLSDGDNQAMQEVVDATDPLLGEGEIADGVTATWAGESYLNLVWQDEMVSGMLAAFASTLAIILVLLILLFRSAKWALLAIAPVLWTILVVYGALGLAGKSYDMPIAVLSTLVLGIGVDFAIHFVERYRELREDHPHGHEALAAFFAEPARALTRNASVLAVGFTPLFFSSLTPYLVVGAFLASILVLSWLASIVGLPAAVAGRLPEAVDEPASP